MKQMQTRREFIGAGCAALAGAAAAKSLLANALGVSTADGRKTPGFMKFAGRLSSREAEGMRAFVNEADFSKVDEADWK